MSKTGMYTKYWFLYQVPLIISTNKWLSPEEAEDPDNLWIVQNSVVVNITEACYDA